MHRFFAPLAAQERRRGGQEGGGAHASTPTSTATAPCTTTAWWRTGPFIAQLDQELGRHPLLPRPRGGAHLRRILIQDAGGERLPVGFRKLGMAHLKGLEKLAVYEIVDGATFDPPDPHRHLRASRLARRAIEREFASRMSARAETREPPTSEELDPAMDQSSGRAICPACRRRGGARCATSTTSATRC